MRNILVLAEKPQAARKIAIALAEGSAPRKEAAKKVPHYVVERSGKRLIIGCAVGHLYGLAEKNKNGWTYPVFDIEWKESHKISKDAKFTKPYLEEIKRLCKDIDEIYLSTDKDIEGELLGYNIIRFACKRRDAKRMEFSTLTKPDLIKAFDNAKPHVDFPLIAAGETRHFLDYYYGINMSRALTSAFKKAGRFKILSSGRVQGPALKIIVEREKEIRSFKPVPFWQLELLGSVKAGPITAWHVKDKFWDKAEAETILEKTRGHDGVVASVRREEFKQMPPTPFDLTTMQTEAYRCHRINPKQSLDMAQGLYTAGYISYPRTSSQQLPPAIGYSRILAELSKQEAYSQLCKRLEGKKLWPRNGKKTDPAHPAIYPTGIKPKSLDARKQKIYDLIVRRFLATFGEPALRETMTIEIDVNKELFVSKGTRTVELGWHIFYKPYVRLEEADLPAVSRDEAVHVKEIKLHDKETQPPKRYTQASIIKELERRNLGTKATRAVIIDTLFQRGYVEGGPIEATELGIKTIDTLQKYSPDIIDEELTRHFEEEMEDIYQDKKKPSEVLDEAKGVLLKILGDFKSREKSIGEGLITANDKAEKKASEIGKCPKCGGVLQIKRGKFGRFIACSNYPECTSTFKLPKTGMIKPTDRLCKECNHPMIRMIRKGKKPQELCINTDCPSKHNGEEKVDGEERKCPKCSSPLVLRKSIYGSFYGCSKYPKCRHIEKIRA
ncbi:DNA topoisomerase I [Candidatus Woesearchaeota archaeon CG1_02_47_18]|nr:MAG: DNA topoisomerase I [Candidatus Woesearchaeota archaeon CG1_02_47_18]